MKRFILSALLSVSALAQFPTNSPSVGYQFVPAFPSVSTSDPYGPQFMTTRGNQVLWASRDQKVGIITNPANPTRTLFLDNQPNAFASADSGMPALVFHPTQPLRAFSFAAEREVVGGATNIWDTLREWKVDPANTNRVLPVAQSRVLIRQADRSSEHLGGAMAFGNDGYLYVTTSDEGGQGDPFRNSQRIDLNFFGAVLRIDVDGRPGNLSPNSHPSIVGQYWVPNDNPFIGATNFNGSPVDPAKVRTEFWMVGLRNPNTMHIDRQTGRMFIGDVGGSLWESVQEVVRGANAGWAAMEGPWATTFATGSSTVQRPPQGYAAPFWSYPHPNVVANWNPLHQGNCVFVGPVVRGTKYPELVGCLIISDVSGPVWAVNIATKALTRIATHPTGATSWAIDPTTGDLLAGSFYGKSITRMVRSVPAALPQTLSATGLFSDLATLTPNGLTAYEVANPFWSDGAIKTRWARLPTGGKIDRDAEDKWTFPTGTVWVKHFDVDGRRVETRVTVKTADAAYGLSYKWRADGSDADLASPYGEDVTLPNRTWHIPSWSDCMQCHTPLYGYAPGFRTAQLNVNGQLEALSAAGWFASPITNAAGLPALSRWDSSASIQHRFQSFLDANCSHCHQPEGTGRGEWDARITTPLSLSSIIYGGVSDSLGITGARVIAPGSLNNSILFRRIWDHDEQGLANYHMPPLGTDVINTNGASLVAEFVEWLTPRTNWIVGTNGPAATPFVEFSVEDRINTFGPGSPTALDDDYYTAGTYPAGFNGLTSELYQDGDEPWANWERALTMGDTENRLHFVTTAGPATLTLGLNLGSALGTNGLKVLPVLHQIMVVHRATDGTETVLSNFQMSSSTTVSIPFTASEGPQTIRIVRVGPSSSAGGTYKSAWMNFDYVKINK